jgi:hypothetical protein
MILKVVTIGIIRPFDCDLNDRVQCKKTFTRCLYSEAAKPDIPVMPFYQEKLMEVVLSASGSP